MVIVVVCEQLQCVDDLVGMLVFLMLEYFVIEMVYLVNDMWNWNIGGIFWIGLFFNIQLLVVIGGQVLCVQILIDNVGVEFLQEIEKLLLNGVFQVMIILVSCKLFIVLQFLFQVLILGVLCMLQLMIGVIGNDDVMCVLVVCVCYDLDNLLGMFVG